MGPRFLSRVITKFSRKQEEFVPLQSTQHKRAVGRTKSRWICTFKRCFGLPCNRIKRL